MHHTLSKEKSAHFNKRVSYSLVSKSSIISLIQEDQDAIAVAHRYEALWGSVLLQSASSATVGLQQLTCYHQSLDLTGPLIDLSDTSVTVMAFCWHLCHIAHPAQDLDSLKQR